MTDPMSDFEPNEEYEQSNSRNLSVGLTMLFIGLAAGSLVTLLLTPKTGKQLRRTLRKKYEDAREVLEDIGDQAGDWIDKGAEWADKAKSKMPPLKKPFGR
jgi:gas vesicle protein